MGVEPTPSAWKAPILAAIRYLRSRSFWVFLIGRKQWKTPNDTYLLTNHPRAGRPKDFPSAVVFCILNYDWFYHLSVGTTLVYRLPHNLCSFGRTTPDMSPYRNPNITRSVGGPSVPTCVLTHSQASYCGWLVLVRRTANYLHGAKEWNRTTDLFLMREAF